MEEKFPKIRQNTNFELTNATIIVIDIFFREFSSKAIKTELFSLVHSCV